MNYLLLFIVSIIAIIPIFLIKKYIQNNNILYITGSISLYIILCLSYVKLFKQGDISNIYTLLQILQILIVFFVGLLYFKENINSNKIIGTLLGIGCVYFMLK